MILIYTHSTLQFINWKWKHFCLILRRERACLSFKRKRKSRRFQGYYYLMSISINGVFIGKFGRYRIVQSSSESIWNLRTEAQNMWGKIYFYFSTSYLRRKNSERRDALVCDFLPILQLQADIIPVYIYLYI